jgi:hypothetical protein
MLALVSAVLVLAFATLRLQLAASDFSSSPLLQYAGRWR